MSDNDTTTDSTEVTEQADSQNASEATDTEMDWQAEAEKWKALSRKNEERAKANASAAAELEGLRNASLSDSEKAVENAKAEGRKQALQEVSMRLVDAEFKVAAAGRPVNVDALLDGLDRTRFVNEEGEVDSERVSAFIDGLAPKVKADMGQGSRDSAYKKSTADLFSDATGF